MQRDRAGWDSPGIAGEGVQQPQGSAVCSSHPEMCESSDAPLCGLKKTLKKSTPQQLPSPSDEKKAAQKRTFTRWMNAILRKRDPPLEVRDLYADLRDGGILMALLEELSGCKLLYRFRRSPHRIFRLNNISKVLAFLDDRHVKLLGIDTCAVADGDPSAALGLVWSIILYFQVKEAAVGVRRHLSSSLPSLSGDLPSADLSPRPDDTGGHSSGTLPNSCRNAAREPKYHGRAIKTLLQWVQKRTTKFGVEVHDFGRSWRSGLAFLALIKSVNPALVSLSEGLSADPRENIRQAFLIAHHSFDIPPLLEPEDVARSSPDEQSIITYVSMFPRRLSGTDEVHTADTGAEIPEIQNLGSVEPVSFGETSAEDPAAQGLLRRLERSSEQELWRRWARRSSGGSTSTNQKKGRQVFQPPSPLDAGGVSQEIQCWLEKGSVDRGSVKPREDESHFSLSSEEGIYSLPVLDSDEEEAYSYILDLSRDVFHAHSQPKRQGAKAEGEMMEQRLREGSDRLDVPEVLNGSGGKPQAGSLAPVPDFAQELGVGVPSVSHGTFDLDAKEGGVGETAINTSTLDPELSGGSSGGEMGEGERDLTRQSNDEGDYGEEESERDKMERPRVVENGSDGGQSAAAEVAGWEAEDCGRVRERRVADKEEEGGRLPAFGTGGGDVKDVNGQDDLSPSSVKAGNETAFIDEASREVRGTRADATDDLIRQRKDAEKEEDADKVKGLLDFEAVEAAGEEEAEPELKRCQQRTEKKEEEEGEEEEEEEEEEAAVSVGRQGETALKNGAAGGLSSRNGGDGFTSSGSASPLSRSSRPGSVLQSPPVPPAATPSELELLLVLWMLLYCCLILPQMNL